MKIVTWNLQHGSVPRPKVPLHVQFDYLRNVLKPDLAFLQETLNPEPLRAQGEPPAVFTPCTGTNGRSGKWGSGIWTRTLPLEQHSLAGYPGRPGRVVGATTTRPDGTSLLLVCVHAPVINGTIFPYLETVFCELDATLAGQCGIIGGDLNTARLAESQWPGYKHGMFCGLTEFMADRRLIIWRQTHRTF
jgi:hypothetical protein